MSRQSTHAEAGLVVSTRGGLVHVALSFGARLGVEPEVAEWLASALLNHARVARTERRTRDADR